MFIIAAVREWNRRWESICTEDTTSAAAAPSQQDPQQQHHTPSHCDEHRHTGPARVPASLPGPACAYERAFSVCTPSTGGTISRDTVGDSVVTGGNEWLGGNGRLGPYGRLGDYWRLCDYEGLGGVERL